MNRTLEREIAAFADSLRTQLARLIQEIVPYLKGQTSEAAERIMARSVADLWVARQAFNPTQVTLPAFFGAIVKQNVREYRRARDPLLWQFNEEESAVLVALHGSEQAIVPTPPTRPESQEHEQTKLEPAQKLGQDCRPCYKCLYFYGWLPKQPVQPVSHSDPEIAAACNHLNARKVAIAQRVRSGVNWNEADLKLE